MKIPVRVINSGEREQDEEKETPKAEENKGSRWKKMADEEQAKQQMNESEEEEYAELVEEAEAPSTEREQKSPETEKDNYVRLLADFENYKRHAEAEKGRLAGLGKETVLDDLFPVIEHMELAIKSAREAGDETGILQGIEMVYRELISVLEKHGVERLPSVGEAFDPAIHEAVAVMPSSDYEEGTVIEEVKPGFRRGERLLRPACVVVAK